MDNAKFGGDWTKTKLNSIREYLAAYRTALKHQPFKLIYIDAFAGTGYTALKKSDTSNELLLPELAKKEAQDFIEGSARIALQIDPPFDQYIFIESHNKRFSELQNLCAEFGNLNIELVKTDANEYLQTICSHNWLERNERGVLFLDPFGMQVRWDTIKAIAHTEALDVWILFPLMAVNRLLTRDGEIPPIWRKRISETFGEEVWYDKFYQPSAQPSLLDIEDSAVHKIANFDIIEEYFVQRLSSIFPAVADNPLRLTTPQNTALFLLCFAVSSHNENAIKIALRIAKHILEKRRRR